MPANNKPRARDLGIPFDGTPGPLNAITDVTGVEVGYATLITGSGPRVRGQGPVRTGVTVILPRGKADVAPVYAAYDSFNGAGEMTGILALDEYGLLYGPIGITNTHSVGVVRDALVDWSVRNAVELGFHCPLVTETYDGFLNDVDGFHVQPEHIFAAIAGATSGLPAEGNVGGGTGMILHGWKGGTGTASRVLPAEQGGFTVGVLIQGNYGDRAGLRIAGVPLGGEITEPTMREGDPARGSIIVVVATDAPLLPHQLRRLAKRPVLALGRMGSWGGDFSGDIFLAFSTQSPHAYTPPHAAEHGPSLHQVETLPLHGVLTRLFAAAITATEEAIVNAMLAAEDMEGADGNFVPAIPHAPLVAALRKFNRLA
jgi:L-aminopeptidase/D-esterase-like protein